MSRSRFFGKPISSLLIPSMRNLSFGPKSIFYRGPDGKATQGSPLIRLHEEAGEVRYPTIRSWQVFGIPPWHGHDDDEDDDDEDHSAAIVRIFVWDHRAAHEEMAKHGMRYQLFADVTFYLASHAQMMQWMRMSAGLTFQTPSFDHLLAIAPRNPRTARGLRVSLDVPWADTAHHWSTHEPGSETVNAAWEALRDSIDAAIAATPAIEHLDGLRETWANDAVELGGAYRNRPRRVRKPDTTP